MSHTHAGFKHSAAIGEAVAQQVAGQTPAIDLSPFAIEGPLRQTAVAG